MPSRRSSGVGDRLQAALAGLQELHVLRDRQGDLVSWALGMDREEPVSSVVVMMGAEEQRLEATLSSLKQQLSRLRKQDVGLKTHLQQLDQQIHELKLDVRTSTEQLESDSRPSSGFYELSDGGSCSRSNSCTSVYSECLSSSQTSLVFASPSGRHVSPPPQVDACHSRRSADESQPTQPRTTGLHLGSSRIRAKAAGVEHARPRPVSTGDLDRMMTQGLGCFKSAEAKKPLSFLLEPKFQPRLDSPSRTEAYQYLSPLHAVTLQSPLLLLEGGEAEKPVLPEGPGAPDNGYDPLQTGSRPRSYMDQLLQRSLSKIHKETVKPEDRRDVNVPEACQKCASALPPSRAKTNNAVQPIGDQKRQSSSQEPMNQKPGGLSRCYRSDEVALKKNHKEENAKVADKKTCSDPREQQNPGISRSFGSPELVHAMFVPAGSQRRQADRRTRSMKLRPRGGGAKPRATKHQQGVEARGRGKATNRADAHPELKVQPRTGSAPAFGRLGKGCGPQCLEYEHPAERRRRRRSDADVGHAPCIQRSRDSRLQASQSVQAVCSWTGPPRAFRFPVFSGGFLHTLDSSYPPAPAHPPPGPYPPRCESEYSAECPSLFHSTIAESSEGEASENTTNRFGDSESSRSLRSCSDSDSSLSPEEEEERGLVWAEASLGRPLRQPPPRPEPSTCRIKASRALKKKIRRFQPASLKVMTLV